MSTMQLLRSFVSQRLTAAVEEIMGVFERTITEYEQEISRHRRLLGAEQLADINTLNTGTGVSEDVRPLIVLTDNPPPGQQREWPSCLEREDPEPPRVKEEQEDFWSSQEADIPQFQSPPATVKSEDDDEGRAEEPRGANPSAGNSFQRTDAAVDGCGGSDLAFDLDVAGFLKAANDGQFFLSQCFKTETEDSGDGWKRAIDREAASHNRPLHQKKTYRCPACGKTFKHNTALQRHITCHTGERPFDCAECGKKFRQKGSLHIHMRKHTGEKPFSCVVCGKNFTQSGTLAAHMRIHTGEKPFSCSVCKKRYNERGTLVRHMRVHTGEKPFTCTLCGKRFSEKGNLNKHKRIHTGEKPFGCGACEKTFSLLSHLKNHKCPSKKTTESAELQLKCPKVTVQLTRPTL